MLIFGRFLIFFALAAIASSQLNDVDTMDRQLSTLNSNNKNKELRVIAMVKTQLSALNTAMSGTSSIAKLQSAINDTITLYNKLSTIDNFGAYENISTCNDINIRITTLEMEIRRYATLQVNYNLNASYVQTCVNYMTVYFAANRASVSSTLNFQSVIDAGNSLVRYMISCIETLALSASTYAQIRANLITYKSSYCICQSTITDVAKSTVSTLESNIAKVEAPLVACQRVLIAIAKDAQTKVTTANSAVTNASLKDLFAKLLSLFTKIQTLNDYSNGTTTTLTSCTDLTARVGLVQGKIYTYARTIGEASTSYSLTYTYAVAVNATVRALNSTFSTTQREALLAAAVSTGALCDTYSKTYIPSNDYAIRRARVILAEIRRAGDEYCGCSNASDTGTTTTEATTTEAEETTSEETTEEGEETTEEGE